MSRGYVYVLSNPAMPGLVKVGRSISGGRSRAKELYQTGVPHPFSVEFEVLCDEHCDVENEAHQTLESHRVNGSREFFKVCVDTAVDAVIAAAMSARGCELIGGDQHGFLCDLYDLALRAGVHHMELGDSLRFITNEEAQALVARRMAWVKERQHG